MQWGGKADATDGCAMYDLAHAAGINFFDTAHGYTGGASETLLGEFVAADRNDRFIATKCASPMTRITSPAMAKVGCIPQTSAQASPTSCNPLWTQWTISWTPSSTPASPI